jgi:hypothetical protein
VISKTNTAEENWYRIIRGFYNYFHAKGLKVGSSMEVETLVPGFRGKSYPRGPQTYYGTNGFNFIKSYYDFIVSYGYALNLEDFQQWFKPGYLLIDQNFPSQKKFWIITRPWNETWSVNGQQVWVPNVWEPEAIALEMKNSLDGNMVILTYSDASNWPSGYTYPQFWQWILKGVDLYNNNRPYYEQYVYGTNLLTGYVGNTYGWVET